MSLAAAALGSLQMLEKTVVWPLATRTHIVTHLLLTHVLQFTLFSY